MIRSRIAGRPGLRPRKAGITLTEILISILIMGVGMLSLATLFPLGLMRLRDAARSSRSAMLFQSAGDELSSRDLLYKLSFPAIGYSWDPFTQDPATPSETGYGPPTYQPPIFVGLDRTPFPGGNGNPPSAYYNATLPPNPTKLAGGAGLPVCYDPMWWYQVGSASNFSLGQSPLIPGLNFRFGSGLGHIRPDPDGAGQSSVHGLQRISNFPLTPQFDPSFVFASPDDLVMQTDGTQPRDVHGNPISLPGDPTIFGSGRGSPIVPDMSQGAPMVDYSYTWMFTGRQTDVSNGTVFDGEVVIFNNRLFGIETINGQSVAAGETTVEAIWGYGGLPLNTSVAPYNNYNANDRAVLLRWPVTQSDPDVRVGGYIADVTYERYSDIEVSRFYSFANPVITYPAQRCYWYRVAKKTDVTSSQARVNDPTAYREMTVTVASPLRAKTPLTNSGNGTPAHVNAALICPSVVNVVPKVVYTR